MSGPKRAGICMRRRPKDQVQQPQPDLDDEDEQLLSPLRTDAKRTASKQKTAPQPRKPRVPAWKLEAIRLEAERAREHFKEIDEFELLEEVASPESIKQVKEQVAHTPQEDTENVPPRQHSLGVESTDCAQGVRESQQFQEMPDPTNSKSSTTGSTFATPAAGTPDGTTVQYQRVLISAKRPPVQDEPSVGNAISESLELLKPSDLGSTTSLSRELCSPSNAETSANSQTQPSSASVAALASGSRATRGLLETPHAAIPSSSTMHPAATTAVPASHRLSESDGAHATESVACQGSEQRPSSVSSARHNMTPSSFKSLSDQLSQLTPTLTPAASPMLEASPVASVPADADAPAQPEKTPEADTEPSADVTSVPAAGQVDPPEESFQSSASCLEKPLSASLPCTDVRQASILHTDPAQNIKARDSCPLLETPGAVVQQKHVATGSRAISAQAATPIPSRRQQKLLKARVSLVLQDPSQRPSLQNAPPHMSQASAVSGRTPGVSLQSLHTSHMRSSAPAANNAHASPHPRTALLNSLLSRRSVWSVIEQGAQQADVINFTQTTPRQTPPALHDSVSNRRSSRHARGSISMAPRQSIMPDPSPIYEQSETSDHPSISSVGEIPTVATPVATPIPSADRAVTLAAASDGKPQTTPEACSVQPQDNKSSPKAAYRQVDSINPPLEQHNVQSSRQSTASPTANVIQGAATTGPTAPSSKGFQAMHERCIPVSAAPASNPSVGEAFAVSNSTAAAPQTSVSCPSVGEAVPMGTCRAQGLPTPASSPCKTAASNPDALSVSEQAEAVEASISKIDASSPVSGQAESAEEASDLQTDSSTHLRPAMSASSEDTAIRQTASIDTAASSEISEPLSPLEELLMLCNQSEPMAFKAAMNELTGGKKVEKLAEGSFKEVFLCGNDVIQVMPIEGTSLINDLEPMSADKVIPEITALAQLARLNTPTPTLNDPQGSTSCCAAFPNTKRVVVVSGKYHAPLLAAWKRFAVKWAHDEEKCQNECPGKLPASQLYIIMVVQNGGCDLEGFSIKDFKTAKNLLLQATLALAVAESCLEFEHRDLHWGNILVDTVPNCSSQIYRLRGRDWNVRGAGIKICLIDFTLSRLIGPNGTVKCSDLGTEDMSWLFTQIEEVVSPQQSIKVQESNCMQTEAYYAMKQQAEMQWGKNGLTDQQGWHTFTPCTNVQWVAYLAKILRYKKYKKHKGETYKGVSMTSKELSSLSAFMKDLDPDIGSQWTTSCERLVHHPFFADMLES